MKNFITEWKPALFNSFIYLLFIVSCFYLTWAQMLYLCLVGCVCSILGNSVLLHRYYTHRAFKLSKVMEFILLPFAIIIGIGSPIMYAAMHRQHHRVTDTAGDPHSPSRLGWFPVLSGLWEFYPASYFKGLNAQLPKDLFASSVQRFIHVNYYRIWLLSFIVCATINLPVAIAVFGWIPVYQKVFENLIVNGICHPATNVIKDWAVFGFITGGESMQDYHHKFPDAIKYSDNWLVDPGYPVIEVIKHDTTR